MAQLNRKHITYNPEIVRHLMSTVEFGRPAALDYLEKITGYERVYCTELLNVELGQSNIRVSEKLARHIFKNPKLKKRGE